MSQYTPTITLITDFGHRSPYTGIMKGVISAINPDARIIDISHEVSPHDIREGAFILLTSYSYFRPGTIYIVVIDPGVGGRRRGVVFSAGDYYFVGPDNGVMSWGAKDSGEVSAFELNIESRYFPEKVSSTFHGRDIFARASGHLSSGVPIKDMGDEIDDPVILPFPDTRRIGDEITGEIIYIDDFGNLITNISTGELCGIKEINVRGVKIGGLSKTYGDVDMGELLSLISSSDFLEIAVNQGSAREMTGAWVGDEVRVIVSHR